MNNIAILFLTDYNKAQFFLSSLKQHIIEKIFKFNITLKKVDKLQLKTQMLVDTNDNFLN